MSKQNGGPKVCARFEAQTWRRSLCRNCFKTRREHPLPGALISTAESRAVLEENASADGTDSAEEVKVKDELSGVEGGESAESRLLGTPAGTPLSKLGRKLGFQSETRSASTKVNGKHGDGQSERDGSSSSSRSRSSSSSRERPTHKPGTHIGRDKNTTAASPDDAAAKADSRGGPDLQADDQECQADEHSIEASPRAGSAARIEPQRFRTREAQDYESARALTSSSTAEDSGKSAGEMSKTPAKRRLPSPVAGEKRVEWLKRAFGGTKSGDTKGGKDSELKSKDNNGASSKSSSTRSSRASGATAGTSSAQASTSRTPIFASSSSPTSGSKSSASDLKGKGVSEGRKVGSFALSKSSSAAAAIKRKDADEKQPGSEGKKRGALASAEKFESKPMLEESKEHSFLVVELREELEEVQDKCSQLELERGYLKEQLQTKRVDIQVVEEEYRTKLVELEQRCAFMESENRKLLEKWEAGETALVARTDSDQKNEENIFVLREELTSKEILLEQYMTENDSLRQEIEDLHVEMDEINDQFRVQDENEFRELQRELEETAKNCRILQFKLRKAERKNEIIEADRMQYEEKVVMLQDKFENPEDWDHIRELHEELKMAKEVSVRLHDELELVEERRAKIEDDTEEIRQQLGNSESKRLALENELERTRAEVSRLESELKTARSRPSLSPKNSLEIPDARQRTPLGLITKDNSVEYDVAQLMRDLGDAKEREDDMKEQLRFSEEEAKIMRRKLADLEEENESLGLQIRKMSSSVSTVKHRGRSGPTDREPVTEREHDLRLQLELAEQENIVLRRKMSEKEQENENLFAEVKFLQKKLVQQQPADDSFVPPSLYFEDKVKALYREVDDLKWQLVDKEKEMDKLKVSAAEAPPAGPPGKRGKLQKSRSLDLDQQGTDYRRQLEMTQQEVHILREKLQILEIENERLIGDTRRMQMAGTRKIPSIQTDDAALQNIELTDRVRELEQDNITLRDEVKSMDERFHLLSRQVVRSRSRDGAADENAESRDLREQLLLVEEESTVLRRKMAELEADNSKLNREMNRIRQPTNGKERTIKPVDEKMTEEDMRERISEQDNEISDMLLIIKGKEETNEQLEDELNYHKEEFDHMLDIFQRREKELLDEIESLESKNNVISNLLDLVTERAEATQGELDRHLNAGLQKEASPSGDVKSSTGSRALSEASTGSDEVFLGLPGDDGKKVVSRDWEEQFKKRIECLEELLAEERQRTRSAEKKLADSVRGTSGTENNLAIFQRENDMLKKELSVCKDQLSTANEHINDLKERLHKVQETHDTLRMDLDNVTKELDGEKDKKREYEEQIMKWKQEKEGLHSKLQDFQRKTEALHNQLQNQQEKWTGEEKAEMDTKSKEQLEHELSTLQADCSQYKLQADELQYKLQEVNNTIKAREEEWEKERWKFEKNRHSLEDKLQASEQLLKSKDEALRNTETVISDKEKELRHKDDVIRSREEKLLSTEEDLNDAANLIKQRENEIMRTNTQLHEIDQMIQEKDKNIKHLEKCVRQRDDRLNEKDSHLEKNNAKLEEQSIELERINDKLEVTLSQLKERETQVVRLEKDVKAKADEIRILHSKLEQIENTLHSDREEAATLKATLKKEKDELKKSVQSLQSEKSNYAQELEAAKEQLSKQKSFADKKRARLELELKQTQEKLKSEELARAVPFKEMIKRLTTEKEELIGEKHRMTEQVKNLKKESKSSKDTWEKERDELQKIIDEKTQIVEDNLKATKAMQDEINKLKESTDSLTVVVHLPTESEVSSGSEAMEKSRQSEKEVKDQRNKQQEWEKEKAEILESVSRQEKMWKTEHSSMQMKFEGRLKAATEELNLLQAQVERYRRDNEMQREMLNASQKAITELKVRHDIEVSNWKREKHILTSKSSEVENTRKALQDIENKMADLRAQLSEEQRKRGELQSNYTTNKSSWEIERAEMQSKLNRLEEANTAGRFTRPSGRMSRMDSALEKERQEHKRLLTETHSLALDLQEKLNESEEKREREKRELMVMMDSRSQEWNKQKKAIEEKAGKLEEKARMLSSVQLALTEVQERLKRDRENWRTDREALKQRLEESRNRHRESKQKMTEIFIEVKKLKEMTPKPEQYKNIKKTAKDTKALQLSLDETYVRHLSSALEQITKVTEEVCATKEVPEVSSPPPLRRSYSTSLLELDKEEHFQQDKPKSPRPPLRRVLTTTEEDPQPVRLSTKPVFTTIARPQTGKSMQAPPVGPAMEPLIVPSALTAPLELAMPKTAGISTTLSRSSAHISGTRSAATSRSASPEKRAYRIAHYSPIRKNSPYPSPPPSMIVTPKRCLSVEREGPSLTQEDISRVYEKLAKDVGEEELNERKVERGSTPKLTQRSSRSSTKTLRKSYSVDSPPEEPVWQPGSHTQLQSQGDYSTSVSQSHEAFYGVTLRPATRHPDDGPRSDTGHVTDWETTPRREFKSEAMRQRFYEDYPMKIPAFAQSRESKGKNGSIADLASKFESGKSSKKDQKDTKPKKPTQLDIRPETSSSQLSVEAQRSRSTTPTKSAKSTFSKYMPKEVKKKLFGRSRSLDRSISVDRGGVQSSIKKIGVSVMPPAAPSTFKPPDIQPQAKSKRRWWFKKSSSLDEPPSYDVGGKTSMTSPITEASSSSYTTSSSSATSPTVSVGRDVSDSSISSKLSRHASGTSVLSGSASASSTRGDSRYGGMVG